MPAYVWVGGPRAPDRPRPAAAASVTLLPRVDATAASTV